MTSVANATTSGTRPVLTKEQQKPDHQSLRLRIAVGLSGFLTTRRAILKPGCGINLQARFPEPSTYRLFQVLPGFFTPCQTTVLRACELDGLTNRGGDHRTP